MKAIRAQSSVSFQRVMAEQSKQPQIAVAEAIHLLQTFRGADLTQTIYQIEKSLKGVSAQNYSAVLTTSGAKAEVLGAAGPIKQLAGQINVVIHALGILLCLPHILRPGEVIDYVSLGAGNTGRAFDLETSLRVAEFKFIAFVYIWMRFGVWIGPVASRDAVL